MADILQGVARRNRRDAESGLSREEQIAREQDRTGSILTSRLRSDPNARVPDGYSRTASGMVTRDKPGALMEHPWLFPLLGAGAGIAGGAALGGAAAGAGGAGAGTAAAGVGTGAATTGASTAGATGGILGSSTLGTGMTGTVLGGTGLGTTAAGAGAGAVAAGTGTTASTGGTMSTILRGSQAASSILGNMADRNQRQQQSQDEMDYRRQQDEINNAYRREQLRLQEPGIHMGNIQRAHLMQAGPVQAHWNGPGSGLRGETVRFSGGFNEPQTPEVQAAMSQLTQQELERLLHPDADTNTGLQTPTTPQRRTSTWDRIIGGAAVGTSILGSLYNGGRNAGR